MHVGGPCIGCTMPGFPDKFAPFYKAPPGSMVSSTASRTVGFGIRRLRHLSHTHLNREVRWDELENGNVPSGWGKVGKLNALDKTVHFFYQKLQYSGSKKPGREDTSRYATDSPPRARGMQAPHDVSHQPDEE